MSFRILALVLGTLALDASAIQECTVNGKPVNLNHGDSTRTLTGTVVCREQGAKTPAREQVYVNGVQTVMRYYHDNGKLRSDCGRSPQGNSHGLCKEWDENGKLTNERFYENGDPKGLSKFYYPSGAVQRIAFHLDFYKKTELAYNEDGSLRSIECSSGSFSQKDRELCGYAGKPGKVRLFAKKGQPFRELTFENGKLVASKEIDMATGKVAASHELAQAGKDGVKIERFANGKTKQETRYNKDGKLNGVQKEFAESGQLTREATFDDGFMTKERLLYLNGQTKRLTEKSKKGDKVFVTSKTYWDNGQVRRAGIYQEETVQRSFGWGSYWRYEDLREQGVFKSWREDGTLESEETYANGELQGIAKSYFEDGKKVEREDTYEAGRRVRSKVYGRSGKLTSHDEFFADGSKKSHMKKPSKKAH